VPLILTFLLGSGLFRERQTEVRARTCGNVLRTSEAGTGYAATAVRSALHCGLNHGSLLAMPYRRTENIERKLAARHAAILDAARALASEGGIAAVQIASVAERAGVAAGTVYRYFPRKTELIEELVAVLARTELAALSQAADAAPGPLSALAAAVTTFCARALTEPRLTFALVSEPIGRDADDARVGYRKALAAAFEQRIRTALAGRNLPDQDAATAARALVGALIEGLVGPLAPETGDDPIKLRAAVHALALFALRALGVVDARARGLVVQTQIASATIR
jgi:AcrR family transcriptional regulator